MRGNYTRRGADRLEGQSGGRGEHAWNEVVLNSGERILVDVMHNLVTELADPVIESYCDVRDTPLYDINGNNSGTCTNNPPSKKNRTRRLSAICGADWIWIANPTGGRSAYAYLDTMNPAQKRRLRYALAREGIHMIAIAPLTSGMEASGPCYACAARPICSSKG